MARSRTTVKKGQAGRAHPRTTHGIHTQPDEERIEAMQASLTAMLPVQHAADALALRLLAVTVCCLEDAIAWVNVEGSIDDKGKPTSAAKWERRLTNAAMRQLASFGGTPSSRAKLGLRTMQAVDLATALSHPDPERRAELMREAGLDLEG